MLKAQIDTIGLDVPWTRFSFGERSPGYDLVELAICGIAQLVDVVRFGETSLFWYRWDILKVQALFSTPETEKNLKSKGKLIKWWIKTQLFRVIPSNSKSSRRKLNFCQTKTTDTLQKVQKNCEYLKKKLK